MNAVIATGALHALSPDISTLEGDLYQAAFDPQFAGSAMDTGYLTTEPGTRGSIFYDAPTANPNVVTADEATKDTVTVPVLAGATPMLGLPASQQPSDQIPVPVLVVVGADDNLFCTGGHCLQLRQPCVGAVL